MRRARVAVAALAAAGLLLTVLAGPASARAVRVAYMDGGQEAPDPGDEDGGGVARILLTPGKSRVCWTIQVEQIQLPATAAHIHEAPAGDPGPVVVTLSPPDETGHSEGCTEASKTLLRDIRDHPEEYYVNVHNAPFPGGAVRGQLGRAR